MGQEHKRASGVVTCMRNGEGLSGKFQSRPYPLRQPGGHRCHTWPPRLHQACADGRYGLRLVQAGMWRTKVQVWHHGKTPTLGGETGDIP